MPGFINAHMHFYSTLVRGLGKAKPSADFSEVLENLWWRLDRKLDARGLLRLGAGRADRRDPARHDHAHRPPRQPLGGARLARRDRPRRARDRGARLALLRALRPRRRRGRASGDRRERRVHPRAAGPSGTSACRRCSACTPRFTLSDATLERGRRGRPRARRGLPRPRRRGRLGPGALPAGARAAGRGALARTSAILGPQIDRRPLRARRATARWSCSRRPAPRWSTTRSPT